MPPVPLLLTDLEVARSQMAFTLGFHIVLACIGVALPALILVANYRGLKHEDADAMLRCSAARTLERAREQARPSVGAGRLHVAS